MFTFSAIQFRDAASPAMAEAIRAVENTRPMMAAAGGEMARTLREHFKARGGSSFWGEIADATAVFSFDESHATAGVSPPQGFHVLHKLRGGTVRAKPPRKMMAIPANDQARKAGWPSYWSKIGDGKLKALWGSNGPYALSLVQDQIRWNRRSGKKSLVAKDGKKGNWGRGVIMYWLKRSVTHRPDPDAVPALDTVRLAALGAIRRHLDRLLKKGP